MSQFDLLILDGRHLLWRTADAFADLHITYKDKDGTDQTMLTGGMYGFLTTSTRIHSSFGGKTIVAWDGPRHENYRLALYPQYKTKKEGEQTVEERIFVQDMNRQEQILRQHILPAMGVRQYVSKGCEADDVMATIANRMAGQGLRVLVYTGDSDLRQIVCPKITVAASAGAGRDAVYDEAAVVEKHGVSPSQIADLKALSGDNSDNIPGVPGVGKVFAARMLQKWGDLETVLGNCASAWVKGGPVTERIHQAVQAHAEDCRLYLKLTTVDINAAMVALPIAKSQKELVEQLQRYRFRSLMAPAELNDLLSLGAT